MAAFVKAHANEAAVQEQLLAVQQEMGGEPDLQQMIEQLHRWIDEDKKITPLKTLQGMLWEKGYKNSDFQGHVYADAYAALKKWHQQGVMLYVYSSGSVYAQKLLFGYSCFGDMTALFSGYFDTRIGAKQEVQSYNAIIESLAIPADQILFLSDIEKELDAAQTAGMQTRWLVRDAAINTQANHRQLSDFTDILTEQNELTA
jgi:enolase-phosphatase E1